MTKAGGCRCDGGWELWGAQADDYVEARLVRLQVLEGGHETLYRCAACDRVWLHDFVDDAEGVPTLRLRWLSEAQRPAAVVERMNSRAQAHERLAYVDRDVEFQPYGETRTYRGIAAARRFARREDEDPTAPRAAAISVVEKGDDAVVLGTVALARGGQYVEHRPAAWIVTVRDGKVSRILSYQSWSAAREAAGVTEEEVTLARRLGPGYLR